MAHYLVTGGAGFIGSHLVDSLLQQEHSVRILDNFSTGRQSNCRPDVEVMEGDVADPVIVGKAMQGADGCFHLAAVASVELGNRDWLGTHRTNLTGTIAVFDAARRAQDRGPVPVVYASSAAVYGNNPNVPLEETAYKMPHSAYGADKLGCEQHALVAGLIHHVPTCGLRFFNVYGTRQDPSSPYSGVISIFCKRLKAGEPIVIYGNGSQTRDFIHVSDVVRSLTSAMKCVSIESPIYNVCTGKPTTILHLAEKIAAILMITTKPRFESPRSGDIAASVGSPLKAAVELAFQAEVDLAVGLEDTLSGLPRT